MNMSNHQKDSRPPPAGGNAQFKKEQNRQLAEVYKPQKILLTMGTFLRPNKTKLKNAQHFEFIDAFF